MNLTGLSPCIGKPSSGLVVTPEDDLPRNGLKVVSSWAAAKALNADQATAFSTAVQGQQFVAKDVIISTKMMNGEEYPLPMFDENVIPSTIWIRVGDRVISTIDSNVFLLIGVHKNMHGTVLEVGNDYILVRFEHFYMQKNKQAVCRCTSTFDATQFKVMVHFHDFCLYDPLSPELILMATRSQFPLVHAWALPIARVKGVRFDECAVQLSDSRKDWYCSSIYGLLSYSKTVYFYRRPFVSTVSFQDKDVLQDNITIKPYILQCINIFKANFELEHCTSFPCLRVQDVVWSNTFGKCIIKNIIYNGSTPKNAVAFITNCSSGHEYVQRLQRLISVGKPAGAPAAALSVLTDEPAGGSKGKLYM